MAVGLDLVHIDLVHDLLEEADRQTGDADEPGFSLTLRLAQGGDGLGHDLVDVSELQVMDLDEIKVIHPEARKALLDARKHPLSREIEVRDLGAESGHLRR